MRNFLSRIAPDKSDLFMLLGTGFLVYGIYLICPPAAYIALGLIGITLSVLQARYTKREAE